MPHDDYAVNEARIVALKAQRAVAIETKNSAAAVHRAARSPYSKEALLAADAAIREINLGLHECGALARVLLGGGIVKTKCELIGALTIWMEQMRDANKNPRTSAGEKLFGQRAIERLELILKANQ